MATLRAEFAEQRRLRQEAERGSRNAEASRRALVALARERDALTNERLDRVRQQAERLLTRLQDGWDRADNIRMNAAELVIPRQKAKPLLGCRRPPPAVRARACGFWTCAPPVVAYAPSRQWAKVWRRICGVATGAGSTTDRATASCAGSASDRCSSTPVPASSCHRCTACPGTPTERRQEGCGRAAEA